MRILRRADRQACRNLFKSTSTFGPFAKNIESRMRRQANLFEVLESREKNIPMCNLRTALITKLMTPRRQKLSSLFPDLGSIYDTIILGFTPCGDYLVTLDSLSVRFHLVSLSSDGIKVRELSFRLLQNVSPTGHDGLPWWTSPVEILMSRKNPGFVATMIFARSTDRYITEMADEIVSACDLRIFSSGKLLFFVSLTAVLNESLIYDMITGKGRHKSVLYVSNGSEVSFFLFCEDTSDLDYDDILDESAAGQSPEELRSVKSFHNTRSDEDSWFVCNMRRGQKRNIRVLEGDNDAGGVMQSKFKVEKFLRNVLLPFYYPGLDVVRSLKNFEVRCLGSGETGSYILMVISALIAPSSRSACNNRVPLERVEEREIAYLLAFHPFLGKISILKIRDLGEFYKFRYLRSAGPESNGAPLHSASPLPLPNEASFNLKINIYCQQIRMSDPFLRCSSSSYKVLSSAEAIGRSLKTISHPVLPLQIYNDEACQSYSSEYL